MPCSDELKCCDSFAFKSCGVDLVRCVLLWHLLLGTEGDILWWYELGATYCWHNGACCVRLCYGKGSGTSCVVERGTSCVVALVVFWH